MAESILSQLKGLSGTWKTTKAREGGQFQKLPDGDYEAVCKQARIENSKNSGRLQVAWMHTVTSGSQKGRKNYTYTGLDGDESIAWLKYTITAHGVDAPKNIENLPKYLEKCIEKKVNLTVQTNGQFQNTYVNPFGKSKEDIEDEENMDLEDL